MSEAPPLPPAAPAPEAASGQELTEPQIALLVEQYKREMARYEKAAGLVGEKMRRELREAGIKHMVSHRPKHPDDLAEKLKKKAKQKPDVYSWENLRKDLGRVVTDLAGCRVVVYAPEDEEAVGGMVRRVFAQPDREDAAVERRRGVDRPYWATHGLVHPYGRNDAPDPTVDGAICELQIVTVAAHLYNEIEHDITYKERIKGLPADDVERQLLDEIRGVARVADRLVSELMVHRATRRDDMTHVITDAEDLRYALGKLAKRRLDGGELGRLLGILEVVLERVTPEALRQLGGVDQLIEAGRATLGERAADYDEVTLYTVGLFDDFGAEIAAVSGTWRGPRTAMRRAIELAAELRSGHTGDEA